MQAQKLPEHPSHRTYEELQAEIYRLEQRCEGLQSSLKNERSRREHLELVFEDVLGSLSWKITAPLRSGMHWTRSLKDMIRFRRQVLTPLPIRHIQESENGFLLTGATPEFFLTNNEQVTPSGWVRISIEPLKSSPTSALLYFSKGDGFSGSDRHWIIIDGHEHLIYLPKETTALRLDPFNPSKTFSIGKITTAEIGWLQAFSERILKTPSPLLRNPKLLRSKFKKGLSLLQQGGFTAVRAHLARHEPSKSYDEWVERYDTLKESDRSLIRTAVNVLKQKPVIGIVLPTYNTPEKWLRLAIESVQKQLYPYWELCIADDASTESAVRKIIEEYASNDSRIRYVFREKNGHISAASQSALDIVTAPYVGSLDHDDELTEDALFQMAHKINAFPSAQLIYSDEDKLLENGRRFNPYFKSDWNYDLFLQQNYICHFTVVRTETARAVGGFRTGYEGAQDWDLFLRIIDASQSHEILHIPHILYHWRVIETSTAGGTAAKPYVLEAQKKAISDHISRRGYTASVDVREDISQIRVTFTPKNNPLVSIIIPTKDHLGVTKQTIESILEKTSYSPFEIVIVDNGSIEDETLSYFKEIQETPNVRVIRDERPFNFSMQNNGAVPHCSGELLALVNNDIEIISPSWLTEMVGILQRTSHTGKPDVGCVGARLMYPNQTLQHGGIILGIGGVAGHNHKGIRFSDPGYFNRAILNQNLSTVTAACLLVRKDLFVELNGLEEELFSVAFNDVDFCLRIRAKGFNVVYCAYAELYHHESVSRGYETTPAKFARFEREVENMKDRWGDLLANDPYYNPNLTLLSEDFTFSFPPRLKKPWLT